MTESRQKDGQMDVKVLVIMVFRHSLVTEPYKNTNTSLIVGGMIFFREHGDNI